MGHVRPPWQGHRPHVPTSRLAEKGIAMEHVRTMSRRGFTAGAALASAGLAATAGLAPMIAKASENAVPETWDYDYDIVVCGAGGAGLVSAMKASDEGCSVIAIDANFDIGGHAIASRGNTHSGGGTSAQVAAGVEDSPDQYYLDHTDPACSDSHYNDREVIRECADHMVECFEYLLTKGLKLSGEPFNGGGSGDCETIPRTIYTDGGGWTCIYTGQVLEDGERDGSAVTRPFEAAAREQGVDFMMNRHMDALIQDETGRVVGVRASYSPRFKKDGTQLTAENADANIDETREEVTIHAGKAVILATGGGSGNLAYRTMFNPNWGPEMDGCAGEPWSFQDASGEIAGLAIGAGLGATDSWASGSRAVAVAGRLGCRYNYTNHYYNEGSPVWDFVGGKGFVPIDRDGMVYVNLNGERFFPESTSDYTVAAEGSAIVHDSDGKARRIAGPVWAIFDAEKVKAERIDVEQPEVDVDGGYFFSGDTIEELAENIVNKYYEDYPMDPQVLAQTIADYNGYVDAGEDAAFGRDPETMTMKIETPPFYAAWATPNMHDCLTGLATNGKRQVKDVTGEVIPGLYAAGECAGGHRVHGLGKVQTGGYIAALYASQE